MHLLSLVLPTLLLGVAVGQSDDPSYLGCFSDPSENRVFEWQSSTSAMTVDVCSELGSGSDFCGTQNSTECWCGDNVGYAINGPGDCDMSCSGNSDEICGGSYALFVYSNDADCLGCWSDPFTAETRLFSTRIDESNEMTTAAREELCANDAYNGTQHGTECWCDDGTAEYEQNGLVFCDYECAGSADGEFCCGFDAMSIRQHDADTNHDNCFSDPAENRIFELVCSEHYSAYPFYGTQNSTECWCGDGETAYDANGASDECVIPCAGDPSEMCGGSYSRSVYQQNDVEIPVDPAYRGCYSDPGTNRVFVQDASSDKMTAEACFELCFNSAFYGTQYASECWCGDINAQYSVNGEGVCDMNCSGNSAETCGGSYSMDVYAKDPAYLGCFSDPAECRMFVWKSSTSVMTSESWCGDENANYAANGFGVCDMPCTGNSDEMCGCPYTMSVYQTV